MDISVKLQEHEILTYQLLERFDMLFSCREYKFHTSCVSFYTNQSSLATKASKVSHQGISPVSLTKQTSHFYFYLSCLLRQIYWRSFDSQVLLSRCLPALQRWFDGEQVYARSPPPWDLFLVSWEHEMSCLHFLVIMALSSSHLKSSYTSLYRDSELSAKEN